MPKKTDTDRTLKDAWKHAELAAKYEKLAQENEKLFQKHAEIAFQALCSVTPGIQEKNESRTTVSTEEN